MVDRAGDDVVELRVAGEQISCAVQLEREVVPVRPELELEVALVCAEQEQLDDLPLPEAIEAASWSGWRVVSVPRGVDDNPQSAASRGHLHGSVLEGARRRSIPCRLDAEAESLRHRGRLPHPQQQLADVVASAGAPTGVTPASGPQSKSPK